ncbi:MAG: tRNA (adenosine(37)-N6)-threonylcarbamoyltransferase complex ATPase subunit type 1 TsaE [Ignavibacteria bacterium]|nr:tRNA (adenosine(37)-N6)-threonylcarbamoyltransferase complex ATPase subunit type 1 TsaE [Ignavibacteria bacterium]
MNLKVLVSNSPEETFEIAKDFSSELKPGDIVALIGNLGTGKTIFVKGICAGLNAEQNPLSPTFSIINEYNGKYKIYHFDFYRIKNIEELYDIGYEDYFNDESICLIEWADMFPEILPKDTIEVKIEFGEIENQRKISIKKL